MARIREAGKGAFQRLGGRVGPSRPPRGGTQHLEVTRREVARAVGRGECLYRLDPGVPLHRVATELDCLDHRLDTR